MEGVSVRAESIEEIVGWFDDDASGDGDGKTADW